MSGIPRSALGPRSSYLHHRAGFHTVVDSEKPLEQDIALDMHAGSNE